MDRLKSIFIYVMPLFVTIACCFAFSAYNKHYNEVQITTAPTTQTTTPTTTETTTLSADAEETTTQKKYQGDSDDEDDDRNDDDEVVTTRRSSKYFESDVIDLINEERTSRGLSKLSNSSVAHSAAKTRAREIVVLFSHTRTNGKSFYSAITDLGYETEFRGENIAAGQETPEDVVKAWMNSPSHRENILNPDYTHIGVAYYYKDSSLHKNYWVQIFTSGVS